MLCLFYGENFLQVRAQKIPYLISAEENELKLLSTMADRSFSAKKNSGSQRSPGAPLIGIGEEREWWNSDSNLGTS
jgi:hypothetical protein